MRSYLGPLVARDKEDGLTKTDPDFDDFGVRTDHANSLPVIGLPNLLNCLLNILNY